MRSYVLGAVALVSALGSGCVVLPDSQLPVEVTTVDQGWTDHQADLFWHESQGTTMVPYDWFMALQTPEIKFFGSVDYFADPRYLSRYGFIYANGGAGNPAPTRSPLSACAGSDNPNCGLPIGLSHAEILMKEIDPDAPVEAVGFTCAACHTGELHLGNTAVRVEGATNLIDVTQFQSALGGALLLTQKLPFRFNRFARNVLASRGTDEDDDPAAFAEQKRVLEAQLDNFLTASAPETLTATRLGLYADYPGGFGRVDALARITNMVFGTDMNNDGNLVKGAAPVKFPSIWDAPYFAWAQYNRSIEQSMTRNVGEALGVRARLEYVADLHNAEMWPGTGEPVRRLESSVDIPGLFAIETMLRGTGRGYFNGLQSPVWPQEISWSDARAGEQLYADHCSSCHLPPIDSLVQWGDVSNARGEPVRGLIPRGLIPPPGDDRDNSIYLVENDPSSGKIGIADPDTGEMYWIANNHPEMLGDLVAEKYPEDEIEYFLNITGVNLGTIGTDPGQAANFAKNIINTGEILLPPFPTYGVPEIAPGIKKPATIWPQRIMAAGVGLQFVTIKLTTQFYDEVDAQTPAQRQAFIDSLPDNLQLRDDDGNPILVDGQIQPAFGLFLESHNDDGVPLINRYEWNGYRPPGAVVEPQYQPHPLNGIWASPPYLHNGSVPNIYQMLSPYEERDKVFYTGNRQYDAEHLGYVSTRFRGGFRYDTSKVG
ncbi:MAG: di-heme-cytochrome C peroxidase, partial [Acidobacteriota bacterium]